MQVGIWIRVSTEEQAQGESPKNHEARARMYAELKGWQVVEHYDLCMGEDKVSISTIDIETISLLPFPDGTSTQNSISRSFI